MEEERQEESTVEVKAEEAVPVAEDAAEAADEEKEDPETVKLREELAAVKGQLLRMEHERYLLSRGVPEEDLDYYAFKIEHSEGAGDDFRKAARDYLKAHPVRRTAVSSGAELGAAGVRKPGTSGAQDRGELGGRAGRRRRPQTRQRERDDEPAAAQPLSKVQ